MRMKLLSLFVMAAAIVPAAMRAQGPPLTNKGAFAAGKTDSTFAFDRRKGMIFLPVRINGSKPLSFVLDTGSTKTLIDRALATALNLKASEEDSLQGAGAGRIPIQIVRDVNIGLPGVECSWFELSTADLKPLESSLGVKVDGIIGYELLSRFVVTVDYDAQTLTFTLPESFHPSNTAQVVPIELRNKWAFANAELVLPGSVTVQDSFLIDSGSSDAVDHPIVMKLQSRSPSVSGVGLGSPVEGATARAASFKLGRYTIAAPIVSCCGATDATSKLIGNEILRPFTVTFDYPSSTMFLTPNSHFKEPFPTGNN